MIGVYNYTVILTFLSLLSASTGIITTLSGSGHPYIGSFFLLFCGLCDAFDGKIARRKVDRTDISRRFGIQIDSLSDLVAFGVLPACIGTALIRVSPFMHRIQEAFGVKFIGSTVRYVLYAILMFYVLAAMIRLAYYNVTEEDRQETETEVRRSYTGLPVTSASLIIPFALLLNYIIPFDLTVVFIGIVMLTAIAFISNFNIKKPGTRGILIMVGIGLVEAIIMIIFAFLRSRI